MNITVKNQDNENITINLDNVTSIKPYSVGISSQVTFKFVDGSHILAHMTPTKLKELYKLVGSKDLT
jgi:hypothetical protein